MARMNWTHTITVVSATILVAVELLVAGIAGGWALAGMFGLGEIGAWVLEALGGALALYLTFSFFRVARIREPFVTKA
ncbi:hypothetical protein [Terrihabitans sp. B22-R8]|uniref:hypothetical protein n=1 Tax=Terrihabitans sp. B22-R8 TaxID=3425128 RepID=UPI00403C47ED